PTVLREVLLGVAEAGLYRPVWSARIVEEWARAAAKSGTAAEMQARGEIALLRANWPGAEVAPGEDADLWLPDPGDVHVLATARSAGANTIVTFNLKDFPKRELGRFDIVALHPDAWLYAFWRQEPDIVRGVVVRVHDTAAQLLGRAIPMRELMKRARLPRLGKAVAGNSRAPTRL
ncbi:MAG: PIN domain-containing protein, partial [Pseudomonadota bacterium]